MEYVEPPFSPIEPSPWWLRGLSIFMVIMTITMLFQIVMGALTPIMIDQVPRDFNELEPYPDNGTQQEIDDWKDSEIFWNETINYLDQFKNFSKYYAIYGIILFFLGLITIPILWAGQRELGIKLTMYWLGIYVISQLHLIMMFYLGPGLYPEYNFADNSGANFMEFIQKIWLLLGVGQIIFCNTILLAVILFISSKSKPQTNFDITSAFHSEEK